MAKRREQEPNGCDLGPRQRTWLLNGMDWAPFLPPSGGPHDLGGFAHLEEAAAAWEACREELLDYWTQDPHDWEGEDGMADPQPGGPGTRPSAWWLLEAPDPRQLVGDEDRAVRAELRAGGWLEGEMWREFFGRPAGPYLRCEPQRAYLERLDLWRSAAERRAAEATLSPWVERRREEREFTRRTTAWSGPYPRLVE